MHKLRAKYVIGHVNDQHVIYSPGEVVYKGDTIVYVGPYSEYATEDCIDYNDAVISPGFIDLDACIDTDHALFDIAIPTSEENRFELDATQIKTMPFSHEDFNARHRYSIAHLLKNGITTAMPISGEQFYPWNFSREECELMVQNGLDLGIRLYIGPSYKSKRTPNDMKDIEREKQSVQDAKDFVLAWKDKHDLIRPIMNPCQINVTELEILKDTCYFAHEHDIPFRIHACEAIREWNYTTEKYGLTTISLFERESMLFNKFIIPHCITATNKELTYLHKAKASIVNTPLADLNFATALFSFEKYADYGVNHTLGTDTLPGDMIRNLRACWDLGRLTSRRKFFARYTEDAKMVPLLPDEPDYPKLDAGSYFNAATVNGANALGRRDLGRLQEGCKADIIVIDLNSIHIGGVDDPIRSIINGCTGRDIRDVFVSGIKRVENFELMDVVEAEIVEAYQKTLVKYKQYYHEFDAKHKNLDEMFPPSYHTNPK